MATTLTAAWSKDGKHVKLEMNIDGRVWRREVAANGELTVREAAQLAGVAPVTVLRWITDGHLVARNGSERTTTVRASDVRECSRNRGLL